MISATATALALALIAGASAAPVQRRGLDLGKTYNGDGYVSSDFGVAEYMARSGKTLAETAAYFWPDAVVPYTITPVTTRFNEAGSLGDARANIEAAMRHIEAKTVVRFIDCGGQFSAPHHLCASYTRRMVITDETAASGLCHATAVWSTDAKAVTGSKVDLGSCITNPGIITHELGHALGLYHEHQRFDRQQHVLVSRAQANANPTNLGIKENVAGATFNFKYDFKSIMHYPIGGASGIKLNPEGQARMAEQAVAMAQVGHFQQLSQLDAAKLNLYYRGTATKFADDTVCTKVYIGAEDLVVPSATLVEAGSCGACATPATKRGVKEVLTPHGRSWTFTHWACGTTMTTTTTTVKPSTTATIATTTASTSTTTETTTTSTTTIKPSTTPTTTTTATTNPTTTTATATTTTTKKTTTTTTTTTVKQVTMPTTTTTTTAKPSTTVTTITTTTITTTTPPAPKTATTSTREFFTSGSI